MKEGYITVYGDTEILDFIDDLNEILAKHDLQLLDVTKPDGDCCVFKVTKL